MLDAAGDAIGARWLASLGLSILDRLQAGRAARVIQVDIVAPRKALGISRYLKHTLLLIVSATPKRPARLSGQHWSTHYKQLKLPSRTATSRTPSKTLENSR